MSFYSKPKPEDFKKLSQKDFDFLNSGRISLGEKIWAMSDILQLSEEEIDLRLRIVSRIIEILKPYYPDCNVFIFGSSFNGFGFRGCDLDLLFLPFPEYCNLDFKGKGNDNIPLPKQILNDPQLKKELLLMEDKQHLKFVKRVMATQKKYFRRVIFIPAKCPILNIAFAGIPFTCDFSSSNRLGMCNTELLHLFGKFDSRVKPLIMFLRYWAKSLGFISKSIFSSYAFSLMVIFYLQNVNPPVLPSIKSISEKSGYSRIVAGWETAISFQINHFFRFQNFSNTDRLLIEFFEFYWNFDFIQNVVSPYHGRPLPVKELKESNDERIKEFLVTPLSVQDAFVLSQNISRNANMKTSFKLALLIAKKLLVKTDLQFQSLFDFSLCEKELAEMFHISEMSYPNFSCFPLYLNYELCYKLRITSSCFHPWYRKVTQVVLDVLQYGLLTECEVVDAVYWRKKIIRRPAKKKKKMNSENVANFQLIMSIQCDLHPNTLIRRKEIQETELKSEKDNIDLPKSLRKEFKISNLLIKKETESYENLKFMCHCYKYPMPQIPDVVVTFFPLIDNLAFRERKGPLNSFVQKHVKQSLEDFVGRA